ncbi:MAG: Gfo/Idh/MocA family protein [Christensenellales bacterium]
MERLKFGMVGGGFDSFIGDVHIRSARFDGLGVLCAGCFSSRHEKTLRTGARYGLSPDRLYPDFETMAVQESSLKDGIDFVIIATPNHLHYAAAKAFLQHGIHVVCDKPLTHTAAQAEELERLAAQNDLLFCVTYVYSGYAAIPAMRKLIDDGVLGDIRTIDASYKQGWLAANVEAEGQNIASWRLDPNIAGASMCVADIGVHALNLISRTTGLRVKEALAMMECIGRGRVLDTNAHVLMRYDTGASGHLWCSGIAIGHDNDLSIGVYGSLGSLQWKQEDPEHFKLCLLNGPVQEYAMGGRMESAGGGFSRMPAGCVEGYYEAFANVYRAFMQSLLQHKQKKPAAHDYPSIADGVEGVRFIEACVRSAQTGNSWVLV